MAGKDTIERQIERYYRSWFKINDIYSMWAKAQGMQETTLFVLHEIFHAQQPCTQRQICEKLLYPKQTVSQIISGLEKDGHIVKALNPDDRRNKAIRLTQRGEAFASELLSKLKSAEAEALNKMGWEQGETVVKSFEILADLLEKSMSQKKA